MWHTSLYSNMNFPAPLAVMGFLAAGGGIVLTLLAIVVAYFVRKPRFAALLLRSTPVAGTVYLALLLAFSFGSRDTTLSPGQEKYFCEIDCHLAYAVLDAKPLPAANAVRYIVTLRTRFDETTISSHRPKDYPLQPSPRTVLMLDDQNGRYAVESSAGTPLAESLIPGQSYTTELHFTIPARATGLKLLVSTTPQWPDRLLIGDENSWLHKKTYFQLQAPRSVRAKDYPPPAGLISGRISHHEVLAACCCSCHGAGRAKRA